MIFDKDSIRQNQNLLRDELVAAGATFKGERACTCPFHEDRNPSAGIYEKAGVWSFKCQACGVGGDIFDVMSKRTGRSVEDILRGEARKAGEQLPAARKTPPAPPKPPKVHATLEALKSAALWVVKDRGGVEVERVYCYTNPAKWTRETKGEEALAAASDLIVLRVKTETGKTFIQGMPVDGGFILKTPPHPHPLYNRLRIQRAKNILVVEGEKAVETATPALPPDWAATTSPGGAKNGVSADWSILAGKNVFLWPDFDPIDPKSGKRPGEEHMRAVAAQLRTHTPDAPISWIDPEAVGLIDEGQDIVEYLEQSAQDGTEESRKAALAVALQMARPLGESQHELERLIEEEIAGKHRTVHFPWPITTRLSRALRPGTITLFCGDPGSGKSLTLVEAVAWWVLKGIPVAAFELEEDRPYHLKRILAQLAGNSDLTDADWVEQHPTEAREYFAAYRDAIKQITPCIDAAPDTQPNYRQLFAWMEAKAAAGARIIVIDPITAAATSEKPWLDDLRFMMAAKAVVRKYGCSLVLVTHPRIGKKKSTGGLDDIAGGAAFPRFSQTMLWMICHETPKAVMCSSPHGPFRETINRSLRLGKTRNGPGAGAEIGFNFSPDTLKFEEMGVVEGDAPEREPQANDQVAGGVTW